MQGLQTPCAQGGHTLLTHSWLAGTELPPVPDPEEGTTERVESTSLTTTTTTDSTFTASTTPGDFVVVDNCEFTGLCKSIGPEDATEEQELTTEEQYIPTPARVLF